MESYDLSFQKEMNMSRHINKQELINKVRELAGLTNDEKSALLELLNEKKTYGLVWEDHEEAVEEQLREQLPVFREVPERRILSDDADAPNHIIIEAENLHALVALTYTHAGKIDVMYLDPPYNTGNKDFVYNDSYVDSEDSYRHSKWLSFMEKRLKIAKTLLSDKGVIFLSIDDNEQANLKLLCDSIFGEENAIGPFVQNKLNAKNDTINVQKNHEFILCYRRRARFYGSQSTNVIPNIIVNSTKEREVFKDRENYYYLNDPITTRGEGGTLNARPNLGYSFYYNPSTDELLPVADYDIELARTGNDENTVYTSDNELLKKGFIAIRPPKVRGKLGCWTWDINKARKDINLLIAKGSRNRYNVVKRTFVSKEDVTELEGHYFYKENVVSNSRSILDYSTNEGTNAFKSIMGNEIEFNNPKNVDMLSYFISISSSKDSIILDYFAGSGTTLHAAMQLNAEDGGHRQCILVTNNENGICENVTYERNRRVIQGYTTPKGEQVEGLVKNNLRYYKADFISREPNSKNKRELVKAATDLLCIKENLYEEVKMTCNGKTLRKDYARHFVDGDKEMIIIYEPVVIKYIVEELKSWPKKEFIKIYVFSEGRYAYDDDFKDVIGKITLCALPDAIYQAYRRVLPQRKKAQQPDAMVDDEEMKEALADAESYSYQEKKGGEA